MKEERPTGPNDSPVVTNEEEGLEIFDGVLDLALLGVRRLREQALVRKKVPGALFLPALAATASKGGRPAFLLLIDISRALLRRGGLTVSEIAGIVGRPLSTASRLVDVLEHAGLVRRRVNPEDARSRFVALTPRGETVVQELRREAALPMLERLERLSSAERDQLRLLLARLQDGRGFGDGESHLPEETG